MFRSNGLVLPPAKTFPPPNQAIPCPPHPLRRLRRRRPRRPPLPLPRPFGPAVSLPALGEGLQIHAHVVKLGLCDDVFVRNGLVHFYCACSRTEKAHKVFDESGQSRDVVTWNSIITGLARDGRVDSAQKMFDEMPDRDVVSWTAMITGYVQNGMFEEGIECFRRMTESGLLIPNEAILVTVLSASAQLGLLEPGRSVHSTIGSLNFPITVPIGTALVDMYAKCGSIERSREAFEQMEKRNLWTWNAMIGGLAAHGLGKEALALFKRFQDEGLKPASVTFVGVLSACSRSGLVDEGRRYYKLMTEIQDRARDGALWLHGRSSGSCWTYL